jgi:hypothetical protein
MADDVGAFDAFAGAVARAELGEVSERRVARAAAVKSGDAFTDVESRTLGRRSAAARRGETHHSGGHRP